MNVLNVSRRYGFKLLSNSGEHANTLKIDEYSAYVPYAYLIWRSAKQTETVILQAGHHFKKIRSAAADRGFLHSAYMHCLNVSGFVNKHMNETYTIHFEHGQKKSPPANIWNLFIIYGSPLLPLSHISLYIADRAHNLPIWDSWIDSLPGYNLDLPLHSRLILLGLDNQVHESNQTLSIENNRIYAKAFDIKRQQLENPFLLLQLMELPEPRMELIHAVNPNKVKVGDIVTVSTRITNKSKVTVGPVQYRTSLPVGTTLVLQSFMLNEIPVSVQVNSFHAVKVYLRHMPEEDVITVVYQLRIERFTAPVLLTSGTLDYNFFPADNQKAIGNQPSNVIELNVLRNGD